ncbi:MAG: DUF3601 domain-containing protein [Bryobacteraceae bacterium]|nr:DUF3601 domain-containing protein [Bryobacteraceae bacterium]
MFDLNKLDVREVENLMAGGRYRVTAPFADANGKEHVPGEEWIFRKAQYRHDQKLLVLYVESAGGAEEISIPLSLDQGRPGIGRMKRWFEGLTPELRIAEPEYMPERTPVAKPEPDFSAQPTFPSIPHAPQWEAFDGEIRAAIELARQRRYDEAWAAILKTLEGPDPWGVQLQTAAGNLGAAAASVAGKNDELAEWLSDKSTDLWYSWGAQATSGGEGVARRAYMKSRGVRGIK